MAFAKNFVDTGAGQMTGLVDSSSFPMGGASPSGTSFVGTRKRESEAPPELVVPLFDMPENVLPSSTRLSTQREYTFAVAGSIESVLQQLKDGIPYEDVEHFQFRGHGTKPGDPRTYNNAKQAVIMSVGVTSVQNSFPFGVHLQCNQLRGRGYGADGNRGLLFIPAGTPGTIFATGAKMVKLPECDIKFSSEFLRWLYRNPDDEGPNEHEHHGYKDYQFFTDRHPTWQYLNDRLSLKGLSMERHIFPTKGASEMSYYLPKQQWREIREKLDAQKRKIVFVDLTEMKINFVPYGKGGWEALFASFGPMMDSMYGSISVTLEMEFF